MQGCVILPVICMNAAKQRLIYGGAKGTLPHRETNFPTLSVRAVPKKLGHTFLRLTKHN